MVLRANIILNPHKTCNKMGTPMGIAKFANSWTLKDKNAIFPHLRHQMYFQIFVESFENQDTSDC